MKQLSRAHLHAVCHRWMQPQRFIVLKRTPKYSDIMWARAADNNSGSYQHNQLQIRTGDTITFKKGLEVYATNKCDHRLHPTMSHEEYVRWSIHRLQKGASKGPCGT